MILGIERVDTLTLMSNAIKSWSFLFLLSLTLIVFGHMALGREGLLIGLVIGLGINSYVYFFEDKRIISHFQGQSLEGQDPWGLLSLSRKLSAKMRIPNPKIVVLNDAAPQALVVGRSLTTGTLILTEGLLRRLTPQETEAVMAYLLACIKNLNTLAFAVGSFLASSLLAITETLDLMLRFVMVEKKNPDYALSQVFTRMAAPLIGLLLRISIRPSFYFNADKLAGELTGDAKIVAQTLWKLHSYSSTEPFTAPLSISHMFVVNPLTRQTWTRYFHAQPSVERRIRSLVGHYPI